MALQRGSRLLGGMMMSVAKVGPAFDPLSDAAIAAVVVLVAGGIYVARRRSLSLPASISSRERDRGDDLGG